MSSGAGDLDMFHRVLAAGLTMRYEPAALVWHQHRRDRAGLRRQIYHNGRSFGVYLGKIWARQSVPRAAVVRYAIREWGAGWLAPSRVAEHHPQRDRRTPSCAWAELLGVATAPWAYWRTRPQRASASSTRRSPRGRRKPDGAGHLFDDRGAGAIQWSP